MTGPARIWRRVNQDFAWIGWRTVGTGMKWRRRVLLGFLGGFKAEFVSVLSDFLSDSKVCQSWFTVDAVGNRTQQFQDGDGALHVARTPFFRRICWSLQTANVPWKRRHGGSYKIGAKIIRNWWLFKMGKPEAFQQDQPITIPREMTWTTQSFTAVRCCGRFWFPSPRVSDDGGWHPRRRKLGSPLRLDSLLDASWIESGRCSTLTSGVFAVDFSRRWCSVVVQVSTCGFWQPWCIPGSK